MFQTGIREVQKHEKNGFVSFEKMQVRQAEVMWLKNICVVREQKKIQECGLFEQKLT